MAEQNSSFASRNSYPENAHDKEQLDLDDGQDLSLVLTGKKLALAFTGLLLSILLVALDQTIVATALPVIASQFNALNQVTWIASAYFLTQSGFLLLYGKVLTVFDRKWVYLGAILIFELGSLFCGIATNATFLIFGRAVAGTGAAGIFVSCLTIISEITLLKDRPRLFGAFGAVFGASSVIGPLMGGAFTDHVSWRWCFFINLPVGAVTILTVGMIIKRNPPKNVVFPQSLKELDYIGAFLALGMITSLVLPLQWGGNLYPWSSKQVIISFCFAAVLIPVFAIWEKYGVGDERAILPMRFFLNRTMYNFLKHAADSFSVAACIENFFIFFGLLLTIYYLPLQFQAVKGHSATQSGIDILPYMLSNVLAAGVSGFIISATGHYWPFVIFGPWIVSIGAGLMYTFTFTSSTAQLVGYQIIFGAGLGFVMQHTMIAVQADVKHDEIPQASALCSFLQLVGGVLGIAVAGTIFSNQLTSHLQQTAPNAPIDAIRESVTVIKHLDPEMQIIVKKAYVDALDYVYLTGVPVGILASISGAFMRRHNIKGKDLMGGT